MIPRPTINKTNSQTVAQDCHPVMQAQWLLPNRSLLLQGASRAAASAPDNYLPDFTAKSQASLLFASTTTTSGCEFNPYFCSCREAEGQSPVSGDPWANCEFHIKWKRYAYIQCSWDTRATLSQLGGYKRVVNYMKRWDDLQVGGVCLVMACCGCWKKVLSDEASLLA